MDNTNYERNKLRSIWHKIIERCTSNKFKEWDAYGGRGAYYTEEWNNFDIFVEQAKNIPGYSKGLLLEGKIELDKDIKYKGNLLYSKDTCLWITHKMNMVLRPSQMKPFLAYNIHTGEISAGESKYVFCDLKGANHSTIANVLSLDNRKKSTEGWYLWYIDNPTPTVYKYYGRFIGEDTWYYGETRQQLSLAMGMTRTVVASKLKDKEYLKNSKYELIRETVNLDKLTKGLETKFSENEWGELEKKWIDSQLSLMETE